MEECTAAYRYQAFGLSISSEVEIQELPAATMLHTDVYIARKSLRSRWENRPADQKYFYIKEDFVMFEIEDTAIFLIENGSHIYVDAFHDSKHDQVCLYLLGTCMGSILMQRKILPLHGSAVAIDGKVYAIVGDSGAGKSTLAAAFLRRGYKLLSDDVIPVTVTEQGIPLVTPAYPQQKLWIESLDQFGMDSAHLRPIIQRETKFAVPVTDQFLNERLPLAGVIELVKTDEDIITLQPIHKLHRFQLIFAHTYRKSFIERLGLVEWHFTLSARMLNQLSLYQLKRPVQSFTANELADLILSTIQKESVHV
ncbi:HPr kinase/phosphorylase [Jeotgalibacillus proteolyticus]|uniref:HPr kinase/phosphorylase n=1 Tax=Jeotgalibacillus proteolyticus TaxID=2082395 RepID=UPI003CF72948